MKPDDIPLFFLSTWPSGLFSLECWMTWTKHQKANPCSISLSTSPPAACTAFMAASLSRLLLSTASRSRRALVLELPLGATPVMSNPPSLGVKLTKPISPPPALPPLASRDLLCLRIVVGVPGTSPRPEALRFECVEPPELWRECAGVGDVGGARFLRIGEHERCLAPDEGARGGR